MNYPKSLNQFLLEDLLESKERESLILILSDLATIGKIISAKVNRAGLTEIIGSLGKENIQGEDVQKLDEYTNTLSRDYLMQTDHFATMASEEDETVVDLGNHGKQANYIIAFDPLDGSSNIDVNASIGTIFSVHRLRDEIPRDSDEQFFQKGRDQVIAGYLVYGTSTQFIFTTGNGVHEFVLDKDIGEFFLVSQSIQIPQEPTYYSLNEAYFDRMQPKDQEYLLWLKKTHNPKSRYIGSLVGDFYRNMIKGGVYLYPAIDQKGDGVYKPKLRLNHECKAIALLAEQAGGMAIDGEQNILDIIPTSLHQRIPLIVGNKDLIESYLNS